MILARDARSTVSQVGKCYKEIFDQGITQVGLSIKFSRKKFSSTDSFGYMTQPSLEHRPAKNSNEIAFSLQFPLSFYVHDEMCEYKFTVIIIRIGDLWTVVPVPIFTVDDETKPSEEKKKTSQRHWCGGMLKYDSLLRASYTFSSNLK